jgi:hypothetical protein
VVIIPSPGKPDRRYDYDQMKPLPAPNVPGGTEAARFDNAVRKMFTVSQEALLKEEAKQKRTRGKPAKKARA